MSQMTFSEHGEDILVHRLLLWKNSGFYLDVGAYDPLKMSLTARLRNFGWTGINIDIDQSVIDSFNTYTPNCINICAAISDCKDVATFYKYDDAVINTICPDQNQWLQKIEQRGELFTKHIESKTIYTSSLSDILKNINCDEINYVNLDIEGLELKALKGFPWSRFRPQVISAEIHRLNLYDISSDEVVKFMQSIGYRLQSYVFHTAIFCEKDFDEEICHRFAPLTL